MNTFYAKRMDVVNVHLNGGINKGHRSYAHNLGGLNEIRYEWDLDPIPMQWPGNQAVKITGSWSRHD